MASVSDEADPNEEPPGSKPAKSEPQCDRVVYLARPWWRRAVDAGIDLVREPGWQGTLKVVLLAVVATGIYVVITLL
jgi:hypothetical protein